MKRISSFFCLILIGIGLASAQVTSADVNKIKRDKNYLYGEATMADKESALQLAYELLENEIKNWALSQDRNVDAVFATKIQQYSDTLLLPRHDMVRAFIYVKISDLKSNKGNYTMVKVRPDDNNKGKEQEAAKQVVDNKKSEAADKPEQSVQTDAAEEIPTVAKEETPVVAEELSPIAKEVLDKLLPITAFSQLQQVIEPLKASGKVTSFGKYAKDIDVHDAYLIIYDRQGMIRAILGPGETDRQNMGTKNPDHLGNYKGCGAIWYRVAK